MSTLKFLPGILVVQAATAALILAATSASSEGNWGPMAALGLIITVLVALWFGSIADHVKKDALADVSTRFAVERENLRVAAETEKRSALEQTHQRIVKETNRAHARANLKLGFGLVCLVGLGAMMFAIQFMTVGLMVLASAGGALGGYMVRARQDAPASRQSTMAKSLVPSSPEVKAIEAKPLEPPSRFGKVRGRKNQF